MDPSAAPWRVFDSAEPPVNSGAPGAAPATSPPPSLVSMLPVSPLTLAAACGIVVLAIAAFVFAASDREAGPCGWPAAPRWRRSTERSATAPPVWRRRRRCRDRRPGHRRGPRPWRVPPCLRGSRRRPRGSGRWLRAATRRRPGGARSQPRGEAGRWDRVVVPSRDDTGVVDHGAIDDPPVDRDAGSAAASLVDLNRATSAELEALPGSDRSRPGRSSRRARSSRSRRSRTFGPASSSARRRSTA